MPNDLISASLEADENCVSSELNEQTIVLGPNVRLVLPNGLSGAENLLFNYTDNTNPGLTVYAGGEAIRLVHFPHAHTDGDTVVFLDGLKVVHMGDMFFNGMFPFLDVANGGDIDNWVKQLDIILGALPADAKIIPGHGPLAGIAELKAFRGMLAASADLVRKQMKAGKTLEEIKTAGVPDSLAAWANGFLKPAQWLELVYRSLEKGAGR
jgi:glyoxylase-like metal-dependent hydrolase (beta-lactamase superfamily II)